MHGIKDKTELCKIVKIPAPSRNNHLKSFLVSALQGLFDIINNVFI